MKENRELRALAREQLKGTWLAGVGVCLVYSLIIGALSPTGIGLLLLTGPLTLGLIGYFLNKARKQNPKFGELFSGFNQFGSSLVLYLLEMVFLALWTCLLVIPGIVKYFSYSMSYFILRDNPEIGGLEAITRSRKMMNGYKGKLFGLYLSFIGWGFLCCLSFGIGFLWLIPYMQASTANFYEDLKNNQLQGAPAA